MVNPVLTVLVDLLLIGSALGILSAMVAEAWVDRRPRVGARRHRPQQQPQRLAPARRDRGLQLTVGSRRVA